MLKGFGFDFNNIFLVQWNRWMVGWLGWMAGWLVNGFGFIMIPKRILLLLKMLFFCEKLISIDILRSLMPEAPYD